MPQGMWVGFTQALPQNPTETMPQGRVWEITGCFSPNCRDKRTAAALLTGLSSTTVSVKPK